MSKLADPDLPPGAIVESHPDVSDVPEGHKIRNDGVVLTPANKNPWYVLATVAGEPRHDAPGLKGLAPEIYEKNRRFWNGWMCQHLTPDERKAVSKKLGLDEQALLPLEPHELTKLKDRFAKEFPSVPEVERIPRPSDHVYFSNCYFPTGVALGKFFFQRGTSFCECYVSGTADFENAYFSRQASFTDNHFAGAAYFRHVLFEQTMFFSGTFVAGSADFLSSSFLQASNFERVFFRGGAYFPNSTFCGAAQFGHAQMCSMAEFKSARFEKPALLDHMHIKGCANFSNTVFREGATFDCTKFDTIADFRGAVFGKRVPRFFRSSLAPETYFSEVVENWPVPSPDNAEAGKKAYTRLRQVAAEVYDPDLEHFFLRQEMCCKEEIERGRGKWFNVKIFQAFRFFADSGISVGLPVAWLAYIWLLGASCFAGYFDSGAPEVMATDIQDNRYWTAMGVSFGNLFGFLGVNRLYFTDILRCAPDLLQFVAGAQTVLGVILLFFFGLGLRNRFRLK